MLEDAPETVSPRNKLAKTRKNTKISKSHKSVRKEVIHAPVHFNTKMVAPCLKQRREDLNRCLEVYDKKLYKLQLINDQLITKAEAHKQAENEAKKFAKEKTN